MITLYNKQNIQIFPPYANLHDECAFKVLSCSVESKVYYGSVRCERPNPGGGEFFEVFVYSIRISTPIGISM